MNNLVQCLNIVSGFMRVEHFELVGIRSSISCLSHTVRGFFDLVVEQIAIFASEYYIFEKGFHVSSTSAQFSRIQCE